MPAIVRTSRRAVSLEDRRRAAEPTSPTTRRCCRATSSPRDGFGITDEGARLSRAADQGRGAAAVPRRVAAVRAAEERRRAEAACNRVRRLRRHRLAAEMQTMSRHVDYYFTPISPYVYLGHERFVAIARRHGGDDRGKADQSRPGVPGVGRTAAVEARAATPGVSARRARALVELPAFAAQSATGALPGVRGSRVTMGTGRARRERRCRARA